MYTFKSKNICNNISSTNTNKNIINKNIIIRILGNDLDKLHGSEQTYINTEFILKNEHSFGNNVDKLYILNRIVDSDKKIT